MVVRRPAADYEVPVEVIQKMLEDAGASCVELARRLGWYRTRKSTYVRVDGTVNCWRGPAGDDARVKRRIGLLPTYNGRGTKSPPLRATTYDFAVQVCEALNLDPRDYDL